MTDDRLQTVLNGRNIRDSYDAETVRQVYRSLDYEGREKLRVHLRRSVEDGRFWDFLDSTHRLMARSDLKRREHFADSTSEWLLAWVATYGVVEDLNTFPRYTDAETPAEA